MKHQGKKLAVMGSRKGLGCSVESRDSRESITWGHNLVLKVSQVPRREQAPWSLAGCV